MKIVEFVSELPRPKLEIEGEAARREIAKKLQEHPGDWAIIDTGKYPNWMFHNMVVTNKFPELPIQNFDSHIVDSELYMRYLPN